MFHFDIWRMHAVSTANVDDKLDFNPIESFHASELMQLKLAFGIQIGFIISYECVSGRDAVAGQMKRFLFVFNCD